MLFEIDIYIVFSLLLNVGLFCVKVSAGLRIKHWKIADPWKDTVRKQFIFLAGDSCKNYFTFTFFGIIFIRTIFPKHNLIWEG